jgi:hypothetical protein
MAEHCFRHWEWQKAESALCIGGKAVVGSEKTPEPMMKRYGRIGGDLDKNNPNLKQS